MEQVKQNILVIASKGMAGHVIYMYLNESGKYNMMDISRSNNYFSSTYTTDVINTKELDNILRDAQPDIVINCVGILNQEAENNPDRAILLNSFLPHYLARKGKEEKFKLIHISTDCVFNGKKGNYKESDLADGIGFYARSKALGEVVDDTHVTLRTSIIGPELKSSGIGLLDWFLKQKGHIKGYTKAVWTGVTTLTLAKVIEEVIDTNVVGLHHVVNGDSITKYQLLLLFKDVFSKDVFIDAYDQYVVDKSLLLGKKDFKIDRYEQMISDMKLWMENHSSMYRTYFDK